MDSRPSDEMLLLAVTERDMGLCQLSTQVPALRQVI
jgi:hypothetical protein